MKRNSVLLFLNIVLFLLVGCNEPFEPKGPYEEKLVVFAVLTTQSDTQYVRIYKTYDPPGFNPVEHTTDNSIVGAQVSITEGATVHQFRDTTIARDDKSRYPTDIHAYVAYQFAVVPGRTYTLNIQTAPAQVIQTQLTVPPQASVVVGNFAALSNPFVFSDEIELRSNISSLTRGFLVRAFIEYDLRENNVWIPKREPFPVGVRNVIDCRNYEPVLHEVQRRKAQQPEQTFHSVLSYITTLKKIWNVNPRSDVRLRRVAFELTQFDRNLYDYFSIANGFRDEFTIRADEPDYSNIPGGLGIFGAMTKQSVYISLPDTLGFSFTCN